MNIANLSRAEREALYKRKMTELQIQWGNPVDDNWNFIEEWSDEELNKGLNDTIGQLRFEKFFGGAGSILSFVVKGFVFLGILGLLVFGIQQLF